MRYPNGYLEMDASSTASKIIDASLSQGDKFWNGHWFYGVSTQEISKVIGYSSTDRWFFLEVPLAATPSTGDDYEIHSIWNAIEIKQAINDIIREVGRIFPDTVSDESLIVQEDKLSYTISGLTKTPWRVNKIFIENQVNAQRGTIQSATSSTFTVEGSSVFTEVVTSSDWRVSIYAGTGKGQIRTLSSHTGAQGTVSSNWTTTPDTTSKYAFWNTADEIYDWIPVHGYRLDSKEFPDTLYFPNRMPSLYGMRIHIEYLALPSALTAEADTTIIPQGYIVPMAMSKLYGNHIAKTKADKETYYAESQRLREEADRFLVSNAPNTPDTTLKSPLRRGAYGNDPNGNPLRWS